MRGALRALHAGGQQGDAFTAELFHAREVDEPVVDPVAEHDRAEERGLRVEVADDQPREAERDGDRGEDGEAEAERRAQIAEEEQDRKEHQRGAEQRGVLHVVDDRLVLGDEEREAAGEAHAQMVRLDLLRMSVDQPLHAVEERAGLGDPQAGAGRPHHDGQAAVVGMDVEAIHVAGEPFSHLITRKRFLRIQPVGGGIAGGRLRRRLLLVQLDGEGVHLERALPDLVTDGVAGALQVL